MRVSQAVRRNRRTVLTGTVCGLLVAGLAGSVIDWRRSEVSWWVASASAAQAPVRPYKAPAAPAPVPVKMTARRWQAPTPPAATPLVLRAQRWRAPATPPPVTLTLGARRWQAPAPPAPLKLNLEALRWQAPATPPAVVLNLGARRWQAPKPPAAQVVTLKAKRDGVASFPPSWRWQASCGSGKYKGDYEGGWLISEVDERGNFQGTFTGAGHAGEIAGRVADAKIQFVRTFGRGSTIKQTWVGVMREVTGAGGATVKEITGTLSDPEGSCTFTATAG